MTTTNRWKGKLLSTNLALPNLLIIVAVVVATTIAPAIIALAAEDPNGGGGGEASVEIKSCGRDSIPYSLSVDWSGRPGNNNNNNNEINNAYTFVFSSHSNFPT